MDNTNSKSNYLIRFSVQGNLYDMTAHFTIINMQFALGELSRLAQDIKHLDSDTHLGIIGPKIHRVHNLVRFLDGAVETIVEVIITFMIFRFYTNLHI